MSQDRVPKLPRVDCDYPFCDDPREHAHCLECGELIAKTEFLCPACA